MFTYCKSGNRKSGNPLVSIPKCTKLVARCTVLYCTVTVLLLFCIEAFPVYQASTTVLILFLYTIHSRLVNGTDSPLPFKRLRLVHLSFCRLNLFFICSLTHEPVSLHGRVSKGGGIISISERSFRLKLSETSDSHETYQKNRQRLPAHAVEPPTLFNPFSDPRLKARPCDRLRMRTKPVIGPSSPSFSMLRFANASSPVNAISI